MQKITAHYGALLLMFMQAPVFSVQPSEEQTIIMPSVIRSTTTHQYMQPVQDAQGKYHYSKNDTHEHINLTKALSFLTRRMFSPTQWIKGITNMFYPAEQKSDPIALLNPTQMIPESHSIEPKFVWIGHSTFLIQINGFNILTDPVMHDVMVGPLVLTKRGMPAGIQFKDLPRIDAILISHNHSDHMDTDTLSSLSGKYILSKALREPFIFVPKGNGIYVKEMGYFDDRIVERNWGENYTLTKDGRSITITCLPAYHWSARFSLSSYRQALWSSWMISTETSNIYFAGDTAYGPHFKEIAQRFPKIDVALMPIGPTGECENKHKHSHVDAPEAVDAFIDLNARTFVPMHYGTFFIGKDTVEHPVKRLMESWEAKHEQLKNKQLLFAQCGMQYEVPSRNDEDTNVPHVEVVL